MIVDEPASGAWNMAMDEALLQSAGRAGQGGCLRFYLWDQPTLSLGYFQEYEDRGRHEPSRTCPVVRRTTGGGAIIHDRELTYSFTCHVPQQVRSNSLALYDAFHSTLIDDLAEFGISASLCPETLQWDDQAEPFLCFKRRSRGDVLIDDTKIAGSAQRRHKKALLQHGSVLLQRSISSPELEGIAGIASVPIGPRGLSLRWAQRVSERLGLSLAPGTPTDEEYVAAGNLVRERFAHERWTCRR